MRKGLLFINKTKLNMPAKPKAPKSPRTGKPEKGKAAATPTKAAEKKQASSGPRGAFYDEFGRSNDVIWRVTKKWNSNLVKFNGNQWSKSPFSTTGFHNAS